MNEGRKEGLNEQKITYTEANTERQADRHTFIAQMLGSKFKQAA
jgi:hypothetical protein